MKLLPLIKLLTLKIKLPFRAVLSFLKMTRMKRNKTVDEGVNHAFGQAKRVDLPQARLASLEL